MIKPEILAPAGGYEQMIAAVRCGADAVYLGTKGFNARRNAENFNETSLEEAVSYCHARGVSVHVTVNTVVLDDELEMLEDTARIIAKSGADAVIIQDLAVMRLFRDRCPTIKRHASTQMAVHNTDGVLLMQELGFDRVVLARELSLREIEQINRAAEIETEIFIHGAHCMSVSGACYLSAMLGGRSGNRGMCAGPCRLDFRYGNQEYALSLKDLSFINYIDEIMDAGTYSFKIEGRMKRPEYVAAAVTACRDALEGRTPDMETLRAVFSRSGFTDAYLTGKRNPDMFGYRRYEDVTAAPGVLKQLSELYKNENPRIPVDMSFELTDEYSQLTVDCGDAHIIVRGAAAETAKNRPTSREDAMRQLGKTGGTPFYLKTLDTSIGENLMLPASELNLLRRKALDELLAVRGRIIPHDFIETNDSAPQTTYNPSETPSFWGRFEYFSEVYDVSQLKQVILPVKEIVSHPEALTLYGEKLIGELPALLFPSDEDSLRNELFKLRRLGLKALITDNAYGIKLAETLGFEIYGGFGLNITNSEAFNEYEKLGFTGAVLSFELSASRIRRIDGSIPRGIIAYGYLPLMRLRACPVGFNCDKCNGYKTLKDRKGINFPLLCSGKKYMTLLNSVPLYVADREIHRVDFLILYFTNETAAEAENIINDSIKRTVFKGDRTSGLYYKNIK